MGFVRFHRGRAPSYHLKGKKRWNSGRTRYTRAGSHKIKFRRPGVIRFKRRR